MRFEPKGQPAIQTQATAVDFEGLQELSALRSFSSVAIFFDSFCAVRIDVIFSVG
jgi:hypothetical protein